MMIPALLCAAAALLLVFLLLLAGLLLRGRFEPPERKFGKDGERIAADEIRKVLRQGDILLNNVTLSFDGRPAELDNVIINENGVFIVEVKRYVGILSGSEEDFEWQKYKVTHTGNVYDKSVKNPIRQVKRQIFLLSRYLKSNHLPVWVEGFVLLLDNKSPVASNYVLSSTAQLGRIIHTPGREKLSRDRILKLRALLK